jgi:acetyl-CoA carboxylase biotin carboxyl carrier protein
LGVAGKQGGWPVDLVKLKELIQILETSQLSEIEIEEDGRRVRLTKAPSGQEVIATLRQDSSGGPTGEVPSLSLPVHASEREEARPTRQEAQGMTIDSPMVGVFYAAPAPGKPVFVNPGDAVEEDQTVCIIEAMKLMNEITAKQRVEIVRVLVENGEPVEFGQPLFAVRPLG